jgi:protein farnesyltransferase/geranylgeranyltransferase type-1 subunit alpha
VWAASQFLRPGTSKKFSNKAQKDLWKGTNEASLPIRTLKKPTSWGNDRFGRSIGDYTPEQFAERLDKKARLLELEVASRGFATKRDHAQRGFTDPDTGEQVEVSEEEVEDERTRRKEIARLRMELYGQRSTPYAEDPEWDDVVPIPTQEPEGALAAIAYPEHYAEGNMPYDLLET